MVPAGNQHLAQARRANRAWVRALQSLQRSTSLTSTGAGALALAAVMWGIGRVVAGRPLYILSYGSVGLLLIAWVMSRRKLPLEGNRSDTRPRVREGDSLDVSVRLTAGRPLSTLILEERVAAELGQTVKLPIESLKRGENIEHDYNINCWRRGAYSVGPLVVHYGDPIGLTMREQVVAEPFEVLVHPAIERVSDRPLTRQFEDPPIRPPVSKPWPSGLEFYGMRDFAPGDDLRRIVWRAVARTGRMLVREAEQGITDRITLILDTNQAGYGTQLDYSPAFETGVRAAASLGSRHLAEGYAVTVEVNAGPLTRPMRGSTATLGFLDAMARVQMDRTPLSQVLTRLVGNNQRDAHNVLVTPHLARADAAQLRLLLNKGVSVLVVALNFGDGYEETAHNAAALGCQVVEVRPNVSLAEALLAEVGALSGRRL